jgi:hypothetical protein
VILQCQEQPDTSNKTKPQLDVIKMSPAFPFQKSPDSLQTTINFDNLSAGTIISNQYPGVIFSSTPYYNIVHNNCGGYCTYSSPPNALQSYPDNMRDIIIDFAQPVKDLTFYSCGWDWFGSIFIDIYERGVYTRTVRGDGYGSYYPFFANLTSFGTKITKIRIYGITDPAGLAWDDFSFTPNPDPPQTSSPIGYQDSVNANGSGNAAGWSLDPDNPSQSNTVHFYIDGPAGSGTFIGSIVANIPRPDVNQTTGYPGNHGYNFPIPNQYRDGRQHTLYAYGIDITGGNPNSLLVRVHDIVD